MYLILGLRSIPPVVADWCNNLETNVEKSRVNLLPLTSPAFIVDTSFSPSVPAKSESRYPLVTLKASFGETLRPPYPDRRHKTAQMQIQIQKDKIAEQIYKQERFSRVESRRLNWACPRFPGTVRVSRASKTRFRALGRAFEASLHRYIPISSTWLGLRDGLGRKS